MSDTDAERTAAARRAMDERMAARAREVEERRAARLEAAEHSGARAVPQFEAEFGVAHAEAVAECEQLSALSAADAEKLEACAGMMSALHAMIAKVATILPTAILESSTRKVEELEGRLKAQRERLAPKKKFAFRNRSKVGGAPGADIAAAAAAASAAPTAVTRDATTDRHIDGFTAGLANMAGLREAVDTQLTRPAALRGALSAAGLQADANLWDKVDDFNWIKTQQSPHWCIVSDEERRGDFDWTVQ